MWNEQKVVADDGTPEAWFGSAVAIAGNIALVGAKNASVNGQQSQGAVYVFRKTSGVWTQVQKLVASDGAAGDQFGSAVALFGSTAIITAPLASIDDKIWQGAAYVFTCTDTFAWSQRQQLLAKGGAAFDTFGVSVAMDAKHAFIGSGGSTHAGQQIPRRVHIYRQGSRGTSTHWTGIQLFDSPLPDDPTSSFGASLAVSGDLAVIGARAANVDGKVGQGMIFVCGHSGKRWRMTDKLTASDGAARDNFGVSVAVHENTILAGAPGATIDGNVSQGAAYVLRKARHEWKQQQKLTASAGPGLGLFGASVSLTSNTALVGAYAANNYRGAAFLFRKQGRAWVGTDKFTASDGAPGDVFGYYSALDRRTTALVGAYTAKVNGNAKQGAAYFLTAPAQKKRAS